MKVVTGWILFFTMLFLLPVTVLSQESKNLLLAENEINGWTFDLDSSCNEGFAKDCTSLFEAIDGGAEVYIERGFVTGSYDGYTDGTNDICIEIYDQGSAANAYLVYHYYDTTASNSTLTPYMNVPNLGDSAHIDTSYLFDYVLELIQSNFFIRLTCPKDDQNKQTMISFAEAIDRKVPIKNYPDISQQKYEKFANISIHPSNDNFLFKMSINTNYFKKNKIPEISIYNSKGLLIQELSLHSFGTQNYIAHWDRKNSNGSIVAKGVYSVVFRKDNLAYSKKFIVH